MPQLESNQGRTLEIRPDGKAFWYPHDECVKKFLGACTKYVRVTDDIEFSDTNKILSLKSMGYKLAKIK